MSASLAALLATAAPSAAQTLRGTIEPDRDVDAPLAEDAAPRPEPGEPAPAPAPIPATRPRADPDAEAAAEAARRARARRGSRVNALPARREAATRAESLAGARGLSRAPNTAVNQPGEIAPPPGLAPPPPTPPGTPPAEDDPFAALGFRLGSLIVRPRLFQGLGYDDNPDRNGATEDGAVFSRTEAEIAFEREDGASVTEGRLTASLDAYRDEAISNRPRLDAALDHAGRLAEATDYALAGALTIETEGPGDAPAPGVTAERRPLTVSGSLSAGVTHEVGAAALSLRGSLDRETFDAVRFTDGSSLSQAERDVTSYRLAWRAAHAATTGLRPFVEAGIERRVFDVVRDAGGLTRDSATATLSAGLEADLADDLGGEASIGYALRRFDDRRLETTGGLVFDASLLYTVSALTRLSLDAGTSLSDDAGQGASYTIGLGLEHDLLRNLRLDAEADVEVDTADAGETTLGLGLGAEWRISREVAVTGRYNYERVWSEGPDSVTNVVLFGLTLRR
jgi:hypothetical protein